MDSVLAIDQDLVTDAVRTLALNTVTAFRNGISMKWNEAELGIYMVYIFGEINKCKPGSHLLEHLISLYHSRWQRKSCLLLRSTNG